MAAHSPVDLQSVRYRLEGHFIELGKNMPYRDEVVPTTREEIAFRLMNTLLRADAKEVDRVLKLYALCARVVENPHIVDEEEPHDRRELLAQSH